MTLSATYAPATICRALPADTPGKSARSSRLISANLGVIFRNESILKSLPFPGIQSAHNLASVRKVLLVAIVR